MKITNLIIMIFASLVFSYFIPHFIDLGLSQKRDTQRIRYSAVIDDFIKTTSDKDSRKNTYEILKTKQVIDEAKYYELLPFSYYTMLIQRDKFPEKFSYYAQNPRLIRQNTQHLSLRPSSNKSRYIPLYTLINTKSEFDMIEYVPFVLRFAPQSIEIIDLDTNSIDTQKTAVLNDNLKKQNFKYPAKKYFSNPGIMKAFDEGAFIVDSDDKIYHIKQIDEKLILKNTNLIKPDIINIVVSEDLRREFYGLIVTKNDVGLIGYDYNIIDLDLNQYSAFNANLNLSISPVDKIVTITTKDNIYTKVMDLNYTKINENDFKLDELQGKRYIKSYFLPFELKISQPSYFYKFEFVNFSKIGFCLSILMAILYFAYRLKFNAKRDVCGAFIVAIFGLYGLISTIFFKEKA